MMRKGLIVLAALLLCACAAAPAPRSAVCRRRRNATARRHAEEAFAEYDTRRRDLAARAQRQQEWSVQGRAKAKRSGETDKFVRHHKRATSEHVAAKARITAAQGPDDLLVFGVRRLEWRHYRPRR